MTHWVAFQNTSEFGGKFGDLRCFYTLTCLRTRENRGLSSDYLGKSRVFIL